MKTSKFLTNIMILVCFYVFILNNIYGSKHSKPNEPGPWPSMQVNTYTGNLFYQRSDLQIPALGDIDLSVVFSFNSLNIVKDEGYGNGWSFSFGMQYFISDSTFTISRGNGEEYRYTMSYKVYQPGQPHYGNISEYSPGKYLHTTKYGIRYYFDDPVHKKLTEIKDRNGNSTLIAYSGGYPVTITDPSEREINLDWSDGHLSQITYSYTTPGRVIEFQYDVSGNMVQVTRPLNNTFQYVYDSNGNLISVTDPQSNVINISYGMNGAVEAMSCPAASYNKTFQYDNCNATTTVSQVVSMINRQTIYTYNLEGQVIHRQHPDGNSEEFEWDSINNLLSHTDENGSLTNYTYDADGNMLSATDCLGNSDFYTYDTNYNMVTQHIDKRGNATEYSYDLNGNLISIEDCITNIQSIECNSYGNITGKTDQNGNTTNYSYNIYGNLTGLTDPLGFTESYTYDQAGNLLTSTDKRGFTSTFTYDPLDRHIGSIDAAGYTSSYTYDGNGNLTSETNANGFTTTYIYDVLNRLISQTDALGGVTGYTYDEAGNLLTETNANGCTETYTYNLRNKPSSHVDDPGHIDYVSYDPVGNILSSTDKNGNTTNYSYDCLGRLLVLIDPGGFTESYTYDANGNRTSYIDKNENAETYGYDCMDRLTSTDFPLGCSELRAYDPVGNTTSFTDRNGNTTTHAYDAMNKLTVSTDPLLQIETWAYDGSGHRTSFTDKNGNTITYVNDYSGMVTSVQYPYAIAESFTFDGMGNKLTHIDKNGNTTNYNYDGLNRLVNRTSPLGYQETNTYDAIGNQLSYTDKNGNTTTYTYDCNGEKLSETDPLGNTITYTYSPVGNPTSVTDKNGNITTWAYSCCRLSSVTDPLGYTESYGYDPAGNRTSITDKNGNITNYTYDSLSRLISITTPLGNQTQYTYDFMGNTLTETDANLNTTTYIYNSRNELIKATFPDASNNNYVYDDDGNLTQSFNIGGSEDSTTYVYDALNRLISKSTNFGPFTKTLLYAYDSNGNNTSITGETGVITYQYDNDNRLGQITDQNGELTTFERDPNGNQTVINYPNGVSTHLSYDELDRVEAVITTDAPLVLQPGRAKPKAVPDKSAGILSNIDGAVTQILFPVSGPGLTENETIVIEIINFGLMPAPGAITLYSIDGGPPVAEIVNQPLNPGIPLIFEFAQPADFSIPGNEYQLTACIQVEGDEDPSNDCLMATIVNEAEPPGIYQSFVYGYDPMGNKISEVHEDGASISFTYSSRNQLLSEAFLPSGNINVYSYTPTGKRASKTENGNLSSYSYNDDNMLLAAGDAVFVNDNNGNRISKVDSEGVTQYLYGYHNELQHITLPDLDFKHFDYLVSGRQFKHTDLYGSEILQSAGNDLIEAFDPTGVPLRYFNPGYSIHEGGSAGFYHYNGFGTFGEKSSYRDYDYEFYSYGGFGSSTLLSSPDGLPLASAEFDAFGNIINSTGTWINNEMIFNGHKFDPDINLYSGYDIYHADPETGIGHLAKSLDKNEKPKTPGANIKNPEKAQGVKKEEKKKQKCCGVKTFVVTWKERDEKKSVGFRIDVTIEFLDDDDHDPACCAYCQYVSTVWEVKDGPNKGNKSDALLKRMHRDNSSRNDDKDENIAKRHKGFKTKVLPGVGVKLEKDDDLDYAFTAEQIVEEDCDSPCPKYAIVAKRGPHTGTVKGKVTKKEGRTFGGVPKTLDK